MVTSQEYFGMIWFVVFLVAVGGTLMWLGRE